MQGVIYSTIEKEIQGNVNKCNSEQEKDRRYGDRREKKGEIGRWKGDRKNDFR